MLFKYYFRYSSLLLLAIATILVLMFLSAGDPGLPRFIKLRAFGIFHELFFFFDNEKLLSMCFLYLYLLIKPFKIVVKVLRVHASACFGLCAVFDTYHAQKHRG